MKSLGNSLPSVAMASILSLVAAALILVPAGDARAQLKIPDLAQVDGSVPPSGLPQAVVVRPRPVKFVVGIGVTGGGDRLASARYYGGYSRYDDDRSIRAGQLLQIHGGLEWRVAPSVTMQATVGYHTDGVDGWNGSIDFDRYPLELLAHYSFAPQWRAGGGLRYTLNPRLDGSGVARDYDIRFKRSLGPVVEVEFLPLNWLGIKLRAVFERYKPRDGGPAAEGNHVGVFANFYF